MPKSRKNKRNQQPNSIQQTNFLQSLTITPEQQRQIDNQKRHQAHLQKKRNRLIKQIRDEKLKEILKGKWRLKDQAQILSNHGNYKKAAEKYKSLTNHLIKNRKEIEEILKNESDSLQSIFPNTQEEIGKMFYLKALCSIQTGQLPIAIMLLKIALQHFPSHQESYFELIGAHFNNEEYEEAASLLLAPRSLEKSQKSSKTNKEDETPPPFLDQLLEEPAPHYIVFIAGVLENNGYLGERNIDNVIKHLEYAVNKYPEANYNLAILYIRSDKIRQAIQHYRKASDAGVVLANMDLGLIFLEGNLVKKNIDESIKYLNAAAKCNYPIAQYKLYFIYSNGIELPQNLKLALYWLQRAADNHLPAAQHDLARELKAGKVIPQNEKLAFEYFMKAAKQKHMGSMFNVALSYDEAIGTDQDIPESAKWYQAAADLGSKPAKYNFALLYFTKQMLTENPEKQYDHPLDIFSELEKKGHPGAKYHLGMMYHYCMGTQQDFEQAERLYKEAAQLKAPGAYLMLVVLYRHLQENESDPNLAPHWQAKIDWAIEGAIRVEGLDENEISNKANNLLKMSSLEEVEQRLSHHREEVSLKNPNTVDGIYTNNTIKPKQKIVKILNLIQERIPSLKQGHTQTSESTPPDEDIAKFIFYLGELFQDFVKKEYSETFTLLHFEEIAQLIHFVATQIESFSDALLALIIEGISLLHLDPTQEALSPAFTTIYHEMGERCTGMDRDQLLSLGYSTASNLGLRHPGTRGPLSALFQRLLFEHLELSPEEQHELLLSLAILDNENRLDSHHEGYFITIEDIQPLANLVAKRLMSQEFNRCTQYVPYLALKYFTLLYPDIISLDKSFSKQWEDYYQNGYGNEVFFRTNVVNLPFKAQQWIQQSFTNVTLHKFIHIQMVDLYLPDENIAIDNSKPERFLQSIAGDQISFTSTAIDRFNATVIGSYPGIKLIFLPFYEHQELQNADRFIRYLQQQFNKIGIKVNTPLPTGNQSQFSVMRFFLSDHQGSYNLYPETLLNVGSGPSHAESDDSDETQHINEKPDDPAEAHFLDGKPDDPTSTEVDETQSLGQTIGSMTM